MTETQMLWLVLALVYGVECLAWLRREALGFRTWFGRHWKVLRPGRLLANQHGGLAWLCPLPPLGTALVARPAPIAIGREGMVALNSKSRTTTRWNELTPCSVDGRKVFRDDRVWFNAGSEAMARHVTTGINRALKSPPEQRQETIRRWFDTTLDTSLVKQRLADFAATSVRLRWWCNALFAYLFLLAPLVVWRFTLERTWWAMLIGLFALTIPTALEFRRAHRTLYSDLEEERGNHFLLVLLSPATAIRAVDALAKPLLETCHPLAAARVLTSEEEFRKLAAETLRTLRHPLRTLPAILAEWEKTRCDAIEAFLQREEIAPNSLLPAPAAAEPAMQSWCPRCLAQFALGNGDCPDCGEVALQPFSPATAPITR